MGTPGQLSNEQVDELREVFNVVPQRWDLHGGREAADQAVQLIAAGCVAATGRHYPTSRMTSTTPGLLEQLGQPSKNLRGQPVDVAQDERARPGSELVGYRAEPITAVCAVVGVQHPQVRAWSERQMRAMRHRQLADPGLTLQIQPAAAPQA